MSISPKNPDCKKCRRAGEKLFLKGEKCNSPKCPILKRNFPPGMHGSLGQRKLTPYGIQLKEKQKAKRIYGLREKQFIGYFKKAFKKVGNTGELLFSLLEKRLDNTVYRLGFAASRKKARQLVSHSHFQVNGKRLNIPSYQINIGDIITIREKSLKSPVFENLSETLKNKGVDVPWLVINVDKLEGKVTSLPKAGDIGMNIDWQAIVEFYSK